MGKKRVSQRMGDLTLKGVVITLIIILGSSSAKSQTFFIDAVAYLKSGDSIIGKTKINSVYTKFIFKEEDTGKKVKLGPRDINYIKTREEFPKKLLYKIVEGSGAEPKIVQKIVDGKTSLYIKIGLSYGFTKDSPFSKSKTTNINNVGERGKYKNQDNFWFSGNLSGITYSKAKFFLGKNNTPFIKPLPKKRVEMLQLFNNCPQAIVKYREVPDKEFDFIQFLNFYNVECAGS